MPIPEKIYKKAAMMRLIIVIINDMIDMYTPFSVVRVW